MKKAAYRGGSATGVDLMVTLADGQLRHVHVEHGHQLPTEIDGVSVPAAFRDNLLAQEDWQEVTIDPKKDEPAKADKEA